MRRFYCLLALALLLLLIPMTASGASPVFNHWSSSGPFKTGLGNRVITALAVSPDNATVFAGSGSGTVYSRQHAPPAVTTAAASGITTVAATLNGTVDPLATAPTGGDAFDPATTVTFEYGTTTAYGSTVTATQSPLTLVGPSAVSKEIAGLTPGVTYHFRVKGASIAGEALGSDLTFTADRLDQSITFGPLPDKDYGAPPFSVSAGSSSPLTVTFSSLTTSVCTVSNSDVTIVKTGTCTIAAGQGGNATYKPAQVLQSFSVNKAILTVTADPKSRSYGAANPVFTASYSGFKYSDSTAVLSGTPVLSSNAGLTSPVGSYVITAAVGTLVSENYTFIMADGALTVGKEVITVTADNKNKLYGEVVPSLTYSFTGFMNGDTGAVITGTPGISTTALTASPVGTYPITVTAGTLAAGNYSFTLVNGTLTVNKLPQSITFDALPAKTNSDPPFTLTATTPSDLAVSYSSSNPAVATISGATVTITGYGTASITASQSGSSIYSAADNVSQTLTVGYGSTPPAITLSALANGATSSTGIINISGTVTALNGLATLTINNAPVTVSSGSFSYPVTLVPGSNTITIIATDNADLSTTVSRSYTFDATAPLISLTSNLTDNSVTNTALTTITGNVYSPGTTVTISVNGGAPQPATMSGTGYSLPVTLVPGLNTVEIIATNTGGKSSQIKLSITYNTSLSLAVTSPARDLRSRSTTLTLSGSVAGAPPLTVTIVMDAQTFSPDVTNGSFNQALTFASEKNYPVIVSVSDTLGNSATVTRNINFIHLGDLDANGSIELADVLRAYLISQGLLQPTATDLLRCDVAPMDADGRPQGDGIIDLGDVIILLRYVIGVKNW